MYKIKYIVFFLIINSYSYSQIIKTPDNKIQGIIVEDENGNSMKSINGVNFEIINGVPNWNLLNEVPKPKRTVIMETENGVYISTPLSEPYDFSLNKSNMTNNKKVDISYPFLGISSETYGNKLALDFDTPNDYVVDINITNIDGNQVLSESQIKFHKGYQKYYIDVSLLKKGGYIISFTIEGIVVSTKFIKE
jgi:hypothetical protein